MKHTSQGPQTLLQIHPDLRKWIDGFLIAKRAQGLAKPTINFYAEKIGNFAVWCRQRDVHLIEQIEPTHIREYLLYLETGGHNPGGIAAYHRTVKAFLMWYEDEVEPENWKNPIRKVKTPKVPEQILEPVPVDDVWRLVEVCGHNRFGLRDKAILLTLLDTGVRAGELLAFNLDDLDIVTGSLTVRKSKSGKGRIVFVGHKTRKAIRAYLKVRGDKPGPLFTGKSYGRMGYHALRNLLRRRSAEAGIPTPPIHSFRRAFAIEMLRSGADVITLQRLLGHSDLSVLKVYLKQTDTDLRTVHNANSPVDRVGK